jgi:RNA polymerase sigma-70 factor (ECF subfamily)
VPEGDLRRGTPTLGRDGQGDERPPAAPRNDVRRDQSRGMKQATGTKNEPLRLVLRRIVHAGVPMADLTSLVERAQRGDHAAFDALAEVRVRTLYRAARLLLRDPDGAEDAVQEALLRAWRDLPTLRDPGRFDAWLHRLLVRSCHDLGRQKRRWRVEVELARIEPVVDDRAGVRLSEHDEIERAFRHLSEPHRVVLVLQHVLGLSTAEVATALRIPSGTVKSRSHFAIEALRSALAAEARLGDRVSSSNGSTVNEAST